MSRTSTNTFSTVMNSHATFNMIIPVRGATIWGRPISDMVRSTCVCVCVYVASRGHVLGGMIGSRYDTLPYVLLCTNGGTVRMVCLRRYPVKFKFEISAQTTLLGFGFFLSWVERFWARTRLSLRDAIRPQGRT